MKTEPDSISPVKENSGASGLEAEVFIEKLLPGGLGLARLGEETLLVTGALPGERVRVAVGSKIRGVRRAAATETLEPSPLRRPADCALAGRCGGCDLIEVDPARALALKAGAALGQLAETYGLRLQLAPSPLPERYRARATLHLGRDAGGRARLGFFDPGRNILEFETCRLLAPELEEPLGAIRQWAAANADALPGPGEEIEVGLMKHAAGPLAAICFSPPPARRPGFAGRRRGEKADPRRTGHEPGTRDFSAALAELPLFLSRHGLTGTSLWTRTSAGAAPRRLSPQGPSRLIAASWPEWGLTLKTRPGGFTQVNPAVNQMLVKTILRSAEALGPGPKRALDLYAGLGNISVPLAMSGWEVTAVEEAAEGAEAARENGRGLPNFKVIRGRSEKEADALAGAGRRFELIVLDPPRSGAKDMAPALGRLGAEMILYVACHPAVLERDLPAFVSLGYQPGELTAFDMFPRTSHLETLVCLRR